MEESGPQVIETKPEDELVGALFAGRYRVEAQPHQGTLLREHWQDVFFSDQATLVDVTSGDAAGIDYDGVLGEVTRASRRLTQEAAR